MRTLRTNTHHSRIRGDDCVCISILTTMRLANMFYQLHIDLETLSPKSNAPILSIGACLQESTFYCEIDQSLYDPEVFPTDPGTVAWWAKRGGFQPSEEPQSPFNAIASLAI